MRLAARARNRTGLTQRAFARLLEVRSQSTIARWETENEQTAIEPRGPTRCLLRLIEAKPDLVLAVLREPDVG